MSLITALIVIVAVAFILAAAKDIIHHKMFRRGWAIFIIRWLWGTHWTGEPQTNAGWRRTGTKALTKTGFAPRFYFWPRWKRAAFRHGITFGSFAVLYGLWTATLLTGVSLSLTAATVTALGTWKLWKTTRKHWHRRDWLAPVHASIAPRVGTPLSARPSSWIAVETDQDRAVRKARFSLPEGFSESEHQRQIVAEVAARRLGLESPEVTWQMHGREPTLTLEASTMPTDIVRLKDVIDFIKNSDKDTLILGLGKQSQSVDVSFHEDSPHLGASMGSGAGKSTLARFVAAQVLYKGAIVLVLDIKQNSHPWARGLPNVSYCDTAEQIHDALCWLGEELDRRNDVAKFSSDYEGNVSATVGPRILIVAEELNMTANKVRTYWRDVLNGQGQSPALIALQDVAFAGRQVMMNLFMVGQMLTARVTGGVSGGNEARENVGIRMLARYTKRNWNMLVPEFPMPPNSNVLGRIQVVASGEVRENQVPFITGAQARELSVSGDVAALPPGMPGSRIVPGKRLDQSVKTLPVSGSDQLVSPDTSNDHQVIPPKPVTISEAIAQRVLIGNIHTIRSWRRSDPEFPKPVERPLGGNSLAHYYDPVELSDYQAQRGRK